MPIGGDQTCVTLADPFIIRKSDIALGTGPPDARPAFVPLGQWEAQVWACVRTDEIEESDGSEDAALKDLTILGAERDDWGSRFGLSEFENVASDSESSLGCQWLAATWLEPSIDAVERFQRLED